VGDATHLVNLYGGPMVIYDLVLTFSGEVPTTLVPQYTTTTRIRATHICEASALFNICRELLHFRNLLTSSPSLQGLQELHSQLEQQSSLFADSAPGWSRVLEHVGAAASLGPLNTDLGSLASTTHVAAGSDSLEAAISSLLIWAQHACDLTHQSSGEMRATLSSIWVYIMEPLL
jgi:hypothetical protein